MGGNCCHFANRLSIFLCNRPIHKYLTDQDIDAALLVGAVGAASSAYCCFRNRPQKKIDLKERLSIKMSAFESGFNKSFGP